MVVTFYPGFTKKPNSTARPAAGAQTQVITGEIKGDFSPYAPVIRFRTMPATSCPTMVYCYIASFKRYYFVAWAFVSGFWEASCTCDVLGTYRGQILNTQQFVERSGSDYDPNIIDGACNPKGQVVFTQAVVQQTAIWGTNYESGTYVVGIVSCSAGNNIGAVCYYAMSQIGFNALMFALLNSPNWLNIDPSEISADLQKALINPAQYIVSAVWLPINAATFIGSPQDDPTGPDVSTIVRLGWWSFNLQVNCRVLHRPTSEWDSWSRSFTCNLILHPDTQEFGTWVNLSPYTKVTLDVPPFGCIDLDTTDLVHNLGVISCRMFIHSYTGDATLYIFSGDIQTSPNTAQMIGSLQANVGVQIPVGQIAINPGNFKNAIVAGTVAGAAELANAVMEGG